VIFTDFRCSMQGMTSTSRVESADAKWQSIQSEQPSKARPPLKYAHD
jgi:hypothetical protein